MDSGNKIRNSPPKRIIVIGAGQIGMYLVGRLSDEGFNVILVDEDETIREQAKSVDASFIHGHGCDPSLLSKLQFTRDDMLIAVTNYDEVNILACQMARAHGCPTTIARVYRSFYREYEDSPISKNYWKDNGIDLLFNQTAIATREIENLIENPGTIDTIPLHEGRLQINVYRVKENSLLSGKRLVGLQHVKKFEDLLVAAVTTNMVVEEKKPGFFSLFRGDRVEVERTIDKTVIPRGDYVIKTGDLLYISGKKDSFDGVGEIFDPEIKKSFKHIFILGGGIFSERLAERLVEKYSGKTVYLLIKDKRRSYYITDYYREKIQVLNIDFDRMDILKDEGLDENCIFIAASNDEKNNILSSLMVKEKTGARTIAIIQDTQFVQLMPYLAVDAAIVPKHLLVEKLLRIFHYNVFDVISAIGDDIELMEFILQENGRALGKPISECELPRESIIVGIFRNGEMVPAKGNTVLEANDHIIIFARRNLIDKINDIF